MKFLCSLDRRLEWRWTFVASNGEPIAVSSEGYVDKRDCLHSIKLVQSSRHVEVRSRVQKISRVTSRAKPKMKYLYGLDRRLEWRWTFFASNGEPIAVSSESYVDKRDCFHSIKLVQSSRFAEVRFLQRRISRLRA